MLHQGVLFVPEYYDRHEHTDPLCVKGTPHVCVEYCAGNGTWAAERAARCAETRWLAVEWRFDRVRKIWSKMCNLRLNNLSPVCGEALTFTRYYLPDRSVNEVYVNFPDPWPKGKHAKHRLLQPAFVEEIGRVVKPGGTATLVTDDPPYAEQMEEAMRNCPLWRSLFPPPHFVTEWPGYGTSYFDQLWRGKGRAIRYLHFERL
jgi:tRNA (guanine-N7-)-methyltransferase